MICALLARKLESVPANEFERAAVDSACAQSRCCSRMRASSFHRRGLRGSMRSARSMDAAAFANFPDAASARALFTMLATATLSFAASEDGAGAGGAVAGAGWRSEGEGAGVDDGPGGGGCVAQPPMSSNTRSRVLIARQLTFQKSCRTNS